jgi:predicted enzyme related to lactoylglutathione lyase
LFQAKGELRVPNHPIVHIEFPAADTAAAAKFYGEAFDWQLQLAPEFSYYMFQAEGGPGGGFVKVGGEGEAAQMNYKIGEPLIYIQTDDIDASLAKIESLGGKTLLPKTEIPQTGWFAFFADPAGNRVGLYTVMSQGASAAPEA